MKKAFEKYFQKLDALYDKHFSTLPTVTYSDQLNKSLLVSEPDEDGEVQWKPQEQTDPIEWESIEKELGFSVCDELKAYYSAYFFLMMSGKIGDRLLNFYPIGATEPVQKSIDRNYHDAQYFFPETQIFILGNAKVGDDDNYFICYDNAENKLFCYESVTHEQIPLSDSISQTIDSMEACL
ncbi:MAG: SecY-interacting protein Syd [Lachnospiraceae bacterium]|nr:SecY-interacting protein Syd [Lachnospiraceae bacterium]